MSVDNALLIFLLSAVWGISFLLIRIANVVFAPPWVSFLRCALGALLMWAVLWLRGSKLPPRSLLPWLIVIAIFNNVIPFTFFAWGEQQVPSNVASIINSTTPIWALLISLFVMPTAVTLRTIAGVALGFSGVLLVVLSQPVSDGALRAALPMFSVSLIAMAALAYAIATVLAKKKLKDLDPVGLAAMQLTLAAVILAPIALSTGMPSRLNGSAIAAVSGLGLAGSGIAYLLYYRLLGSISATQLASVTYLLPLWGIFWGLMAHEPTGTGVYLGLAITVVGLLLLNWRPRRLKTSG